MMGWDKGVGSLKDRDAYLLCRMREARALLLRDSEAFADAMIVLEEAGRILHGKVESKGLGPYRPVLVELADRANKGSEVGRLFDVVKDARNSAVHNGAWIRHINERLVDLFLNLEEALMIKSVEICDIMVRRPIVAESWQMLADIRTLLLANSFSCVPVAVNDGKESSWWLVTDRHLAKYLRGDKGDRSQKLGDVLKEVAVVAETCKEWDSIEEIARRIGVDPILILDRDGNLTGIVTSFDLL